MAVDTTFSNGTTITSSWLNWVNQVVNGKALAPGIYKGTGSALAVAVAGTDFVGPSAYASTNGLTMNTAKILGRTTAGSGPAEELVLDTDGTLAANSDARVATQKAVKAYSDTKSPILHPSFTSTVGVGAATAAASGAGISFPAIQSPSTDANTLDDYEEGTWTPGVGGNATYTTQTGTYTKIGRLVIAQGEVEINILGTGSPSVLSGLPFAAGAGTHAGIVSFFSNLAVNVLACGCYVPGGGSSVTFTAMTVAGPSISYPIALFGNSARIVFTLFYFV